MIYEEKIIKQQDEIIGRLTRENESLRESEYRHNEWLRKAKKDAGFSNNISFDIIWEKALVLLKNNPENNI